MTQTSTRPALTSEIIEAAAAEFCERNGWDSGCAADIALVCYDEIMDGYAVAKALERECGWEPTAHDVEVLDCFGDDLRSALRKASIAWARDNNIQPPLPVGSMTTRGEITGICRYDGACYEIRDPNDTDRARRYIVRFEDAIKVVCR